ncbi:MAG: HAD-IIB family hydrolase [Ruminococcaceae bacterium]|nr:HAD-IIB family hydrolase [Oscillospiraceae bacterium]
MNIAELSNDCFSDILIVSDFDGTLRGDDGNISEKNISAIKRFTSHGGSFMIASGRAEFVLDSVSPIAKTLVNVPCILSNGSYLYDYKDNKRYFEKCLPSDNIREVLYTVRDIASDAGIRIVRGYEYLTPDENEEIKKQIATGFMENVKIYTFEDIPVDNINKITICVNAEKASEIRSVLEEKYSSLFEIYKSWKTVLEIQAKGVSKGAMLDYVKDSYIKNGKKIKIYAVGDYENDIDMMKRADFACCLSNSLDIVKKICSIHLCSNNEGAIADLINKIENCLV